MSFPSLILFFLEVKTLRKITQSLTLFLFVLVFLTACSTDNPPTDNPPTDNNQVATQMMENKVSNICDSVGVSRVLALLPAFDADYTQNMFALQTDNDPYGLTIYYEPTETYHNNMQQPEEMKTYAGYLFDSIDKLGYVEFKYRTSKLDCSCDKETEPAIASCCLNDADYTLMIKVEKP